MEVTKKLEQFDLDNLRELTKTGNEFVQTLGQLEAQIMNMLIKKEKMKLEYENLISNENKLFSEISTRYGKGTVNLETGEITIIEE